MKRQEILVSNMQRFPELWGGVECTVNRVGDTFFDQLARSGHRKRMAEDLELFAQLGFKALRTGLHWERFAATQSWECWDEMLRRMQDLRIQPIAGLLHHGSGPEGTNLLDPGFPDELAAFALKVAQRFPHVTDYTPVNEPQTTGRFACLYGYWYPHHRSMRSYVRSLYNQIKGVALSMRAIRSVQPEARLVHTEDAGATYSTPQLEYYRQHREHRRWMGVDLLCGRIVHGHPMFRFMRENGISEREILWFAENPCPPGVLGLNYYVTSDRYLDHRDHLYPWDPGGDTGDEPLIDAEAVRVRAEGITGPGNILRQAWERYHIPVAITEAHLGCDPVEQSRWLAEVWLQAEAAMASGVDVRAVTVWALLGSYDWCDLCRSDNGIYEPGVFNVAGGKPLPTPLMELVRQIGHNLPLNRSALEPGWWQRPDRLTVRPYDPEQDAAEDSFGDMFPPSSPSGVGPSSQPA